MDEIIIDARGCVLGRLSSHIAKELLFGKRVIVVNSEKAVISGSRKVVFGKYKKMRDMGTTRMGPFPSRMPDRILRRTVRGMLPYQKPRGRDAYKRLRTYIGVPAGIVAENAERMDDLLFRGIKGVKLEDLSRDLGVNI